MSRIFLTLCRIGSFRVLRQSFCGKFELSADSGHPGNPLLGCMIPTYVYYVGIFSNNYHQPAWTNLTIQNFIDVLENFVLLRPNGKTCRAAWWFIKTNIGIGRTQKCHRNALIFHLFSSPSLFQCFFQSHRFQSHLSAEMVKVEKKLQQRRSRCEVHFHSLVGVKFNAVSFMIHNTKKPV